MCVPGKPGKSGHRVKWKPGPFPTWPSWWVCLPSGGGAWGWRGVPLHLPALKMAPFCPWTTDGSCFIQPNSNNFSPKNVLWIVYTLLMNPVCKRSDTLCHLWVTYLELQDPKFGPSFQGGKTARPNKRAQQMQHARGFIVSCANGWLWSPGRQSTPNS